MSITAQLRGHMETRNPPFFVPFETLKGIEHYNKKEKQYYTRTTVSLHAQTGQIESCHPYNRDLIEPATQSRTVYEVRRCDGYRSIHRQHRPSFSQRLDNSQAGSRDTRRLASIGRTIIAIGTLLSRLIVYGQLGTRCYLWVTVNIVPLSFDNTRAVTSQ
ncbi:hypothetical protein BJV78DRAFT_184507 [Lactifluus subvellereus]|nr:hypothetical protein BJV78DRAFT_184507 [Lactifluus subvellereus]